MRHATFVQAAITGMLGGLAGTVLMYLFGTGIFVLLGWPANPSFAIIGDSAAAFFAKLGIGLVGGEPLGLRLYYLIGLTLGVMFGTANAGLEPLQRLSVKQRVGVSILFVEGTSLPLLAAGMWALQMSAGDAALWFSISFVMHLIYGLVLGLATSAAMPSLRPKHDPGRRGRAAGCPD